MKKNNPRVGREAFCLFQDLLGAPCHRFKERSAWPPHPQQVVSSVPAGPDDASSVIQPLECQLDQFSVQGRDVAGGHYDGVDPGGKGLLEGPGKPIAQVARRLHR